MEGITNEELRALGFATESARLESATTEKAQETPQFSTGTPVDFIRNGEKMTGVIAVPTPNGRMTAVYSNGETWGGLVLSEKNKVRVSADKERAIESARKYVAREMKSLEMYKSMGYNVSVNMRDCAEISTHIC